MSLVDVQSGPPAGSQQSPTLLDFPSNNPFRNRATSPASYHSLPSPQTTTFNHIPSAAPERPISRNPFLDQMGSKTSQPTSGSLIGLRGGASPTKPTFTGHAAELFDNLTLNDKPTSNGTRQSSGPSSNQRSSRPENVPFGMKGRSTMPGHRPSRSEEEESQRRLRTGGRLRGPPQGLDIFADPPEPRRHRLRRNSDSSIASKTLNPDEERKRRERRHEERKARYARDGKGRPHGSSSKSRKPKQRLDIIDNLDVTSIYGTGLFHHDGPFDACNPDRNRKGAKAAPMKAFAKDSINNTLGGSGPVNSNLDLNQFHGRGAEGFTDYSTSGIQNTVTECYESYAGASAPVRRGHGVRPGVDRTTSYNPVAKVEPVHGDESLGLGTSTFLEGAPASRVAMERRESESDNIAGNGGGLGRKKSIVQKIRGISNANRNLGHSSRVTSPEGHYESPASPTSPGEVQSAGGMLKIKETDPFFTDYDDAYEKKGAQIQIAEERNRVEESSDNRGRAVSNPKRGHPGRLLERRVTHDGAGTVADSDSKKEGFLSRVKSLKGGRRTRPERRE